MDIKIANIKSNDTFIESKLDILDKINKLAISLKLTVFPQQGKNS
jgi:hypothetical protein